MKLLNHRVIYSGMFYVLVILLIIVAKPSLLFEPNGAIKSFGIGEGKTIFSLGVVVTAFSIVSFYLFAVIDIIFGGNKM
jgi:hypothetical protein